MAFIHPFVMLLAVIAGVYTGLLGWQRFQFKRGKAPASAFPWKRHILFGRIFLALLWIGALIGGGYVWYKTGASLTLGLHAAVGVLIVIIFSVGATFGLLLAKRKGSDRMVAAHMAINYGTFIFVALQVVLGIFLVTFFLAR
jgi:hypothetical protein